MCDFIDSSYQTFAVRIIWPKTKKKNENFVRVLLVHCFGIDYPRLIMIA